jgi:AcrR family transcriptional regulator
MFKVDQATGKGQQTRRAILDAALVLFRERGFDSTTMRDIAAAAGVALGAAYYYFPSKEALIQSYYDVVQREHDQRLDDALASGSLDLKQRLQFALQSKLDIVKDDRKLLGVVFRYAGEPDHPLSCLGSGTDDTRRRSLELLDRAIGSERMPADLRQLLTLSLWALQMGVLVLFLYDRSPNQQRTRKLVDNAMELTVRLLSLAKLSVLKPVRGKVLDLLRDAGLLPGSTTATLEEQPS